MASTSSKQDKGKSKKRKGEEIISLKVKSKDGEGEEIIYRVNATSKINELKKDYSNYQSFPINSIDFFFNGREIRDEDTPEQLKMKDGDEIEALIQ
ncbi:Small ubiquitin-related modifier 1 [Dendrobium catenatum]|uniref:Small ubiquitin-related modifier n=1 Tax=Dendrobium catenatum TaxID=906689 RepID=A0A2I0W7E8_9ASPA|nr:Small ubiquitin-related modifier 1 [Dendrobium catenatum]